MTDQIQPQPEQSYCVICKNEHGTRVVGPFGSQAEAVEWAHKMRIENDMWAYTPDLLYPTWLGGSRS